MITHGTSDVRAFQLSNKTYRCIRTISYWYRSGHLYIDTLEVSLSCLRLSYEDATYSQKYSWQFIKDFSISIYNGNILLFETYFVSVSVCVYLPSLLFLTRKKIYMEPGKLFNKFLYVCDLFLCGTYLISFSIKTFGSRYIYFILNKTEIWQANKCLI